LERQIGEYRIMVARIHRWFGVADYVTRSFGAAGLGEVAADEDPV
jgi:hypothetical protein